MNPQSDISLPAGSQPGEPQCASGEALARRGRRVILLVVVLWMLNGFDLVFTMMAQDHSNFNEANPIARQMLAHPQKVIVFKLGALVFATVVLLTYRHRPIVEFACWTVCAVYVVLSFIWWLYFVQAAQAPIF